jgi:hypothetical protein
MRTTKHIIVIVCFVLTTALSISTLGLLENMLGKEIQVVGPFGSIVAIGINVPDVRNVLFFKVIMDTLTDADKTVLIAAGQP